METKYKTHRKKVKKAAQGNVPRAPEGIRVAQDTITTPRYASAQRNAHAVAQQDGYSAVFPAPLTAVPEPRPRGIHAIVSAPRSNARAQDKIPSQAVNIPLVHRHNSQLANNASWKVTTGDFSVPAFVPTPLRPLTSSVFMEDGNNSSNLQDFQVGEIEAQIMALQKRKRSMETVSGIHAKRYRRQ